MISVPILSEGSFNLRDAILAVTGNRFPWPNTVDDAVNDSYGANVCGNIVYELQQVSQSPLAFLSNDMTVTVSPLKDVHPVGEYTIDLVGTLAEYGFSNRIKFTVRVTTCEAMLDVSEVLLGAIENVWYSDALTYDISVIQPDVKQIPDCCHPLDYRAFSVNELGEFVPLPLEITFVDNIFTIKKCNPLGEFSVNDNECNAYAQPFGK